MNTQHAVPTVFISYSHDDSTHKQWVLEFASTLRQNGIDVLLDAWDLRPGDDLPKFMERGVRDVDRVLMICTESYVAKANDGIGGVGYEAMIFTGELVRDLGTSKFIPVIRQKADKPTVPTSVSTRVYINLSQGPQQTQELDRLLQELHAVLPPKPPLGTYNPKRATRDRATSPDSDTNPSDICGNPVAAYKQALEAARSNDIFEWRSLVRTARSEMVSSLSTWRKKYETTMPNEKGKLVEESMEGASAFAPLTAIALAGIHSSNPAFQNQIGLLEDMLNPAQWQRSGLVIRIELPETGAFFVPSAARGNVFASGQCFRRNAVCPRGDLG